MKNKLDEILSLMKRVDNIGSNNDYYEDYTQDNISNSGNLLSPLVQKKSKASLAKVRSDLNDFTDDSESNILFLDMINRIGLYKKSKKSITQEDVENAFTNSIKNRKIFCPHLSLDELRNEIIERNDNKNGELEIEFDKSTTDSNIATIQTPLKLLGRYAPVYEKIRRNMAGRLGQFFELLFGKSPDNASSSDFGDGENAIEIKTKHLASQSGIIAITKFGIETVSELFSNDAEVIFSGPLKEQLAVALNERLIYISKTKNVDFENMVIDVRNSDVSKKNAKRKRIPINTKLEDGEVIVQNEDIANISIYINSHAGRSTPEAIYMVSLTCILRKASDGQWRVAVLMQLVDNKNPNFNRNISTNVPINYVLSKISNKCPTLFIASGEDAEYQVPGWSCKSDVYVYTKADIFKWSGIDDDDVVLYLIKSGQLKIDFGISSGTFRDVNKIVVDSSLSFDYYRLMNRLITFGKELFAEQQLFVYEKTI